MIKGCTKRVIVVKDVRSDIFEEAYFILRPSQQSNAPEKSSNDILTEANRIVSTCECDAPRGTVGISRKKQTKFKVRDFLFFTCGFAFAAACYAAVCALGLAL